MKKANTNHRAKKLAPGTRGTIRRTSGAAAEIARVAGFSKSYVYKVVRGIKPPSQRFLEAIGPALLNLGTRLQTEAFQHEYPEHAR